MGTRYDIVKVACDILRKDGGEIQLSVLKRAIEKRGFAPGTVKDALEKLLHKEPGVKKKKADSNEVFFSCRDGVRGRVADNARTRKTRTRAKATEKNYYDSFAKFLQDRGECTNAKPYHKSDKEGQWTNPDVVGVYDPRGRNRSVEFPREIVTAEIKKLSDAKPLITAFGQACSYILFSHRVYLVAPRPKHSEKQRIKSLCRLLGIGLVFFDPNSDATDASIYQMELRARSYLPDDKETEKFADFIASMDPD